MGTPHRGRNSLVAAFTPPSPVTGEILTQSLASQRALTARNRKVSKGCNVEMVAASPAQAPVFRRSRFLNPVPPPKPEEVLKSRPGRDGRRRVHEAEYFRKYMYLRRQLKPWSDSFRDRHGRTPSLVDVHQADIPGLLDRFLDYLEVLDRLRS